VLLTEDDEALIATVRERLAAPQRVKVALDDL
jgi:RHH-type rel operon transcriptional repressor/antitoxin RelB